MTLKQQPLYLLQINGKTVLEISSDDNDLPVKQHLNRPWLYRMIAKAVRQHAVKRDYQCN